MEWPADAREDLVMAVNEAISNVVDHAYTPPRRPTFRGSPPSGPPGWVQVHGIVEPAGSAHRRQRRARIDVRDGGQWKLSAHDSRVNRPRGRGLPMIRALVEKLTITAEGTARHPLGTSITLFSRPAPRLA
jgi:two-component sensor histidine kinase